MLRLTKVLTVLLAVSSMAATAQEKVDRTISVSGDAELRVAPNQVQLMLAAVSIDKSLAKARADDDERVKRILAAVQKFGIEAKDVQTDFVTVEPRWDSRRDDVREPDGYQVSKSIVVTLRDVPRFDALLQALMDAGANRVTGIEFRTTELRKHRDAARSMAIKAAKEKATAMAGDLGLKLGKARGVSESGWYGYGWAGNRGAMAQNFSQNIGGGASDPGSSEGFAPGLISVRATVQVSFDLE